MNKPPIWIVRDKLNFESLVDNEANYIFAWKCIVDNWLLAPVRHMAGDGSRVTDRGISMLMLLLSFFEPLGAILSGKSSDGASKQTFSSGFSYFCQWMTENGEECGIGADLVYSFARCGLMHSFTMQGGQIFIDAIGVGKSSMCEHNFKMSHTKKSGAKSDPDIIYLIDPWRLIPKLDQFCSAFCADLERSKTDGTDLYLNFKKTFERTIVDPGKVYYT